MKNEQNSALLEAQGLLKQIETNLEGKNGYIWLEALKKFCRQEIPTWTPPTDWTIWKTLSNGYFKSADHVVAALKANGMQIYGQPEAMLRKLNFRSFKPYGVDIVMVGITDLGFDENQAVSYREILKAGKKKGLQKCTPYDAFEIRLEYIDQPIQRHDDEHYLLAMRTIDGGVFDIANHGGPLVISVVYPRGTFGKRAKLFFRLTGKN